LLLQLFREVLENPAAPETQSLLQASLGLFVAGLLFYGWQHYQYIQYGYKMETAQKKQDQLIQRRNVLRLHREQLQNPTRVESMARDMGMVKLTGASDVQHRKLR